MNNTVLPVHLLAQRAQLHPEKDSKKQSVGCHDTFIFIKIKMIYLFFCLEGTYIYIYTFKDFRNILNIQMFTGFSLFVFSHFINRLVYLTYSMKESEVCRVKQNPSR